MPTIEFLERFAEGWNRHDLDGLMTFMTDDCVFETTADPEVCGKRYAGREQVREAFARVQNVPQGQEQSPLVQQSWFFLPI